MNLDDGRIFQPDIKNAFSFSDPKNLCLEMGHILFIKHLDVFTVSGRRNDSPTWGIVREVASASPGSKGEPLSRQGGKSIGNHESIAYWTIILDRKGNYHGIRNFRI